MGALLHDVMEDTEHGYADLVSKGYNHRTLNIAWWLDKSCIQYHLHGEMTYIEKIKHLAKHGPTEALAVKYADLTDNTDTSRPWTPPEGQLNKYRKAMAILEDELSSRDFAEGSHN